MDDHDLYNSSHFDRQDYDDSFFNSSIHGHRFLAPAGGAPTVDYSVISIVVITLGVVLAVEVLRHQLDVAASGNPFFHTVLELMYRELTTLGIVEFCIYLMHKYQEDFNFQMEAMFVDVHFMLFYTAVFNALQSCLVRLLTTRLTDKVWIQTEDMDLRHYVAVRREFDRLESKLSRANHVDLLHSSNHSRATPYSDYANDSESSYSWKSFREAVYDLAFKLRHPHQSRRLYTLMLPIRFHALRAHFIDSYNLPPKFKVSHYLKRSLTSVLLDFVHISSAAWIMLMVTANLLWFISGIILNVDKNSLEVEQFLVFIFFALMILFVAFAFVLFFKMKSIFSNIMHMKLTIYDSEDAVEKVWGDGIGASRSRTKSFDQLTLFWGNNPHAIIVATQYMQFGYALGLAMIFTYYKDFSAGHHVANPNTLLLVLLISYLIFLNLVSVIIPQYTLCTSIGQMVNKDRLNESLGKLKLSEEIRKKEMLEEEKEAEAEIARRKNESEAKNAKAAARVRNARDASRVRHAPSLPSLLTKDPKFTHHEPHRPERKGSTEMLGIFRNASDDASDRPSRSSDRSSLEQRKGSAGMMRIFQGKSFETFDERQRKESWPRPTRKKSLSDGTQLMSAFDWSSRSFDQTSLEPSQESNGMMMTIQDRSGDAFDEADINSEGGSSGFSDFLALLKAPANKNEGQSKRGPRRSRERSHSDGDQFMTNIDPHQVDLHSSSTSPTSSTRLSAAAAHQLHIADEDEPQIDESLLKTNTVPSSHDSLALQVHLRQERTQVHLRQERTLTKVMTSADPYALEIFSLEHEKLVSTRKDGDAETKNDTDQPMNMVGVVDISETDRRPRHRSNSSDGAMMLSIDDTDIANGEYSERTQYFTDHTELSLGKYERKQIRSATNTHSEGVAIMKSSLSTGSLQSINEDGPEKVAPLAELEQIFSEELPVSQNIRQKRRLRARSASEGVSSMRAGLTGKTSSGYDNIAVANSFKQDITKQEMKGVSKMRRIDEQEAKGLPNMGHIDETDLVDGDHHGPTNLSIQYDKSWKGRDERKQRRHIMKTQSEGVALMRSAPPTLSLESIKEREPEKLATLTELAHISTKELPEITDLDFSQKVRQKRRPRARSASEGVASMRTGQTSKASSGDDIAVANTVKGLKQDTLKQEAKWVTKMRHIDETDVVEGDHSRPKQLFTEHTKTSLGRDDRKQRRRNMRTQSAGVALMRLPLPTSSLESIKEREPGKLATLSELAQTSTKELPDLKDPDFSQKVRPKRRQRARSASEGVSSMRAGLTGKTSSGYEVAVANTAKGPKDDIFMQEAKGVAKMQHIYETLDLNGDHSRPTKLSTDTKLSVGRDERKQRRRLMKTQSEGVAFMQSSLPTETKRLWKDLKEFSLNQELGGVTPMVPDTNRVTFSEGMSGNISDAGTSLDEKDNMSYDTTASEDGESDIDDVPRALTSDAASRFQPITRNIDLAAFFKGSHYRIISLIFGPMACFFFVALRVEIFNIYAGTFVDQTNIWRDMLTPSFWVQVSLYCLMITEMIAVLLVFLTKKGREEAMFSCTAAIFGILINVMCLLLLVIAEMKRCCPENDNIFTRLLGPSPSKGYYDPADEYVECCPKFGKRRYGGLGRIEPFTCLIVLSPLRFVVAWYVVKLFGRRDDPEEEKVSNNETHGHHGPDPTSKTRDLWMTAIGAHSDIVNSFGLFSGELLQCMLGIYANEIVRNSDSSDANNESTEHDSSMYHEREISIDITSDSSSRGITSLLKSTTITSHAYFEYPEARLIRRMRRCEMRLLPLLNDEWIVVDVVLTRYELILFDVLDEAEGLQSAPKNAIFTDNMGGKEMSLGDIAKGRKIMDQFNLDDVDFVDIEHRAAIPGDYDDRDIEVDRNNLLEYWQGGNYSNEDYEAETMDERWGHVDEDRLKIHFKDNYTLYLRFMVDLKEMEDKSKAVADDSDLMNHIGKQTKLWCRTIARLRGAINLKQNLPHFGNEDADEMEDFIEICGRDHNGGHHNSKKSMPKTLHKRLNSFSGIGTLPHGN